MKTTILTKITVLVALGFLLTIFHQKTQATVEQVITGLNQPVRLVAQTGDPRLFIVQRNGLIRIFNQQGQEQETFLDIRNQTTTFN